MDSSRVEKLSKTFKAYNQAKTAVSAGCLDEGRTNRALGIALSKNYQSPSGNQYVTTRYSCTCPDFTYRAHNIPGGKCKHIISLLMTETL